MRVKHYKGYLIFNWKTDSIKVTKRIPISTPYEVIVSFGLDIKIPDTIVNYLNLGEITIPESIVENIHLEEVES